MTVLRRIFARSLRLRFTAFTCALVLAGPALADCRHSLRSALETENLATDPGIVRPTKLQTTVHQLLRSNAQVTAREMQRLFEQGGWELVRVKGSHHQYRIVMNGGEALETIPGVGQDLPMGLRRALLKRLFESEGWRNTLH